jgi:hypothetical protein
MRQLIEFPLDDGSSETVVVEVDRPVDPGLERVARPGMVERADESFDAAVARIRPAVGKVMLSVRGLAQAPDDVTVEFGIKFDAKCGVILTSTGVEANLKVTLAWHGPRTPPTP